MEWEYSEQGMEVWPHKEMVLLEKQTLRPFQHKVERQGKWRLNVPNWNLSIEVWSIPNTICT